MPKGPAVWAGLAVAGGIVALIATSITDARVEYRSIAEAKAGVRTVRLAGVAAPGTVAKDARTLTSTFTLDDRTGGSIPVVYEGIPPDTFKDGAEVVVEGRWDAAGGVFRAETLLAKCPSKYQGGYVEETAPTTPR